MDVAQAAATQIRGAAAGHGLFGFSTHNLSGWRSYHRVTYSWVEGRLAASQSPEVDDRLQAPVKVISAEFTMTYSLRALLNSQTVSSLQHQTRCRQRNWHGNRIGFRLPGARSVSVYRRGD